MRRARTLLRQTAVSLGMGVLTLAPSARGELPEHYTLQLQARTNMLGNASGAYNLKPGNLLAGSLQVPVVSDGRVAFRLSITPEGPNAIWWGSDAAGHHRYLLPDLGEDARASDPGFNSAGLVAFAVTGASAVTSNGIYLLRTEAPNDVRIIREPLGASDWSSLALNDSGQLGFRANFNFVGRGYVVLTPQGAGWTTTYLAKEKTLDDTSPYEFLYSPAFNDLGQMAGVGDVAPGGSEYYQELRVFSADGTSRLIAQSRGRDAGSPIYRFASVQPAFDNLGRVAFIATARVGAGPNLTTVFLWDGAELRVVAQNGQGGIKEVEFFPPDMNDEGLIVFRAIDSNSRRAVWVSDGRTLKRVVSEHDIVDSDQGPARVDQETPSNPVFAGSVSISPRGDVSVVAGLAPPENDQEEWGTAIFVAQAYFAPPADGGVDAGPGEEPDAGCDGGECPGEGDSGTPSCDGGECPGEGDSGTPSCDGGECPGEGDSGTPSCDGGECPSEGDSGTPSCDGGECPGEGDSGTPRCDGGECPGEGDSGTPSCDGGECPGEGDSGTPRCDGGECPSEGDSGTPSCDGGECPGEGDSGTPSCDGGECPGQEDSGTPSCDGGECPGQEDSGTPSCDGGECPGEGDSGTSSCDGGECPGQEDSGTPRCDGGRCPSGQDGGAVDAGGAGPRPDSGGCGCQSTPSSALLPWMFLGLAWFGARRRRGPRGH
ncbi:MXAN_5453 family MXYO-CTERM-anchored protein [Myxococcus sp. CA039A]|uniref:MXAN_5453 family MXYO-CTERM-anchored protein n=1 Tax=Myxococcus sp. CA039A TaxID=2741737 RepID=UPI0020C735AB|nr:MXAN_5453 family MXYO-CTERM-anchored protein [Myxococcus sp. CA039A]